LTQAIGRSRFGGGATSPSAPTAMTLITSGKNMHIILVEVRLMNKDALRSPEDEQLITEIKPGLA